MAAVNGTVLPQNVKDIHGLKCGRWTVIRYVGLRGKNGAYWECKCDCGNVKEVVASSLHQGKSRSCGCLQRESPAKTFTTHGMSHSSEYKIWNGMIARCTNPRNPGFAKYGGRGITVCQRWLDGFEYFFADIGPRPSPNHSIDRIDNDGNYEPGNVRWATSYEQRRNTSRSRFYTIGDQTLCMADWAKKSGICPKVVWGRINCGWPIELAISTPVTK